MATYYRRAGTPFPDDDTLKAAADLADAMWAQAEAPGVTDADIEAVRRAHPDQTISRAQAIAYFDWMRQQEAAAADA